MTDLEAHDLILAAGTAWIYMAAVAVAAIAGGVFVRHDSRDWPLPARARYQVLGVAALGSLVGCAIPAFFAGGTIGAVTSASLVAPKTILGGLLLGFLAVAGFKRLTRNTADTSDAFARGAILMMLIGRVGCMAQHCCYGDATTRAWGMDFGDGIARVPVQYLEATGLLVLALGVQWLRATDRMRGRRLFLVFAAYGLMRSGLEELRAPIAEPWLGIGFYQWLALSLLGIGLYQVWKRSAPRQPQITGAHPLEARP
jgi:phosphatidylglycerol:prolipoprotein diacylglycerol transferase